MKTGKSRGDSHNLILKVGGVTALKKNGKPKVRAKRDQPGNKKSGAKPRKEPTAENGIENKGRGKKS